MIVLLKVAATCATPTTTFFFSFLRARPAFFSVAAAGAAMKLLCHLLLAGDRFCRPLARARVGMCALAAHRQALAVTQAPIAAEVHEALDVHRDFASQITFNEVVAVDGFADLDDLSFGQVVDATRWGDPNLLANFLGLGLPDSMNVAKPNLDPLLGWYVDAGDACHRFLREPIRP